MAQKASPVIASKAYVIKNEELYVSRLRDGYTLSRHPSIFAVWIESTMTFVMITQDSRLSVMLTRYAVRLNSHDRR